MPRLAPAGAKHKKVHLPYETDLYGPSAPPPGTYNPQVQQEVERSRRGLNDLLEEIGTKTKTGKRDVQQKRREIGADYKRNLFDLRRSLGYDEQDLGIRLGQLGINFSRSIEDLSTAKQRGQQDYERTLTNMQHEYGSRAEQQTQNAIQQGADEAGTNTASSAVRAANQAFDKGNVDLSHQRSEQDFSTREGRLRQDYGEDVARANEGFHRQWEGAQTAAGRNVDEARNQQHHLTNTWQDTLHEYATKGSHAQREQGIYEQNAAEDAYYEAHKLHPNIKFPGGTPPGAVTSGPHTLYPATPAGAPLGGVNIGGGRRLGAPRY